MSISDGRQILVAGLMWVCLFGAIKAHAQPSPPCHAVSFKVALDVHHDSQVELGGGLLFRVRSQKEAGWFLDIVPAEANSNDYIYPVNLPLRQNPNQTLGAGYGESVDSSLRRPHEMRFLLDRSGYERVSDLIGNVLLTYQTPDPDKAVSDYMSAVDSARKGSLRVHVSSYKTDKTGTLTRIKLRVEITTPLDFQFAPGFNPLPTPCKD
jgi:hypothetical protein